MLVTENVEVSEQIIYESIIPAHTEVVSYSVCDLCGNKLKPTYKCYSCGRDMCYNCWKKDLDTMRDDLDKYCKDCYDLSYLKYSKDLKDIDEKYEKDTESLMEKIIEESLSKKEG